MAAPFILKCVRVSGSTKKPYRFLRKFKGSDGLFFNFFALLEQCHTKIYPISVILRNTQIAAGDFIG